MKLHNNLALFEEAIRSTADRKNLPVLYIEKDYWVTLALKLIFQSEVGDYTVFKGGTALSKCFNLIERFSEDIDLVVLHETGESGNQKTKKLKSMSAMVSTVLREEKLEGVTRKSGMIRKTAHSYPRMLEGEFGQVRDKVILEASWLGNSEPYTTVEVGSYIYEMMVAAQQEKVAENYDLLPFEVKVLEPKRTFCEKIMSLVRFSYGENVEENLKMKIRHTYDLHQMLRSPAIHHFFLSEELDSLLLKVADGDVKSFKNNNAWLENHPNKCTLFADLDKMGTTLKGTYESSFKALVYGDLPPWENVMESLRKIKRRMNTIEWALGTV